MLHNKDIMSIEVRQTVRSMQAYPPTKPLKELQSELSLERIIRLSNNENAFGPSPSVVEAIKQAAETVNYYPDGSSIELKHAIQSRLGIPPHHLVFGNGSDDLIHMLGQAFLGRTDDEVVVGDPSFVRYDATAQLIGCKLKKIPLDGQFRHNLPAMAKATTENTKLLFIANPNNPTGTIVHKTDVDAFLKDLPAQVLVILDEAYFEYTKHVSDYPISSDYVLDGKNVVGLRTFSKAYALAGLRVGYAIASSEVVDALERVREPFNVNSAGQLAAIAALNDTDYLEATLFRNAKGLKRISDAIKQAGGTPCESYANFVWADMGRPAKPIFHGLLQRGIVVRSGDAMGCPNCLRISVGHEDEVAAFVEALRASMKEVLAV